MVENYLNLQLHFMGFLNTPLLWNDSSNFSFKQLDLESDVTTIFNDVVPTNMRLGKVVERFASHLFNSLEELEIIKENITIHKDKRTLGELDCLLRCDGNPMHVEIAYKFYLFHAGSGTTENEHWIGPNKKDNLSAKLEKLKMKQFPLLYSNECHEILKTLHLNSRDIEQRCFFKAQLFTPYNSVQKDYPNINNQCIIGFYIPFNNISELYDSKFFVPKKIDWLRPVTENVHWNDYRKILPILEGFMKQKTSPLCWVKKPNGEIEKCFITWW